MPKAFLEKTLGWQAMHVLDSESYPFSVRALLGLGELEPFYNVWKFPKDNCTWNETVNSSGIPHSGRGRSS